MLVLPVDCAAYTGGKLTGDTFIANIYAERSDKVFLKPMTPDFYADPFWCDRKYLLPKWRALLPDWFAKWLGICL